jgi:hypothetical protein
MCCGNETIAISYESGMNVILELDKLEENCNPHPLFKQVISRIDYLGKSFCFSKGKRLIFTSQYTLWSQKYQLELQAPLAGFLISPEFSLIVDKEGSFYSIKEKLDLLDSTSNDLMVTYKLFQSIPKMPSIGNIQLFQKLELRKVRTRTTLHNFALIQSGHDIGIISVNYFSRTIEVIYKDNVGEDRKGCVEMRAYKDKIYYTTLRNENHTLNHVLHMRPISTGERFKQLLVPDPIRCFEIQANRIMIKNISGHIEIFGILNLQKLFHLSPIFHGIPDAFRFTHMQMVTDQLLIAYKEDNYRASVVSKPLEEGREQCCLDCSPVVFDHKYMPLELTNVFICPHFLAASNYTRLQRITNYKYKN